MTFDSAINLMKIRTSKEFIQYDKAFKLHAGSVVSKDVALSDKQLKTRVRVAHVRALENSRMQTGPAPLQLILFELSCKLLGRPDLSRFFKPVNPDVWGSSQGFNDYLSK